MSSNDPARAGSPPVRRRPVRGLSRRARRILFLASCLGVSAVLLFSCRNEPGQRSYEEIRRFESPVLANQIHLPASARVAPGESDPAPEAVPASGGTLRWTAPEGWTVHAGSGMYAAIFKTAPGEDADEGSIIALPGEAGGLAANTERWLGQVGLGLPPAELADFLKRSRSIRARGGFDVVLLDFNPLVEDPSAPSMLVAIAKPGEDSYFIKLIAPKASLERDRRNFIRFCESLELGG